MLSCINESSDYLDYFGKSTILDWKVLDPVYVKLIKSTEDDPTMFRKVIKIPKLWAREETSKEPTKDDIINDDIECYNLFIIKQIGSDRNRRSTLILWKLPKTGRIVPVILHMDGGVEFDKKFHKYILRETDKMDRDIILGFCLKYDYILKTECYSNADAEWDWIDTYAMHYQRSKSPKRIKVGPRNLEANDFYKRNNIKLEPYEESRVFRNVRFLNETA